MPQSHPNRDSDPLFEFSSEPGVEPASPQAPENAEVAAPDPLRQRVDALERSIDRATKDIAALRKQVATLVASQRDNNGRVDAWHQRVAYRAAAAALGVTLGIGVAAWSWTYATASPEPILTRAVPAPPPAAPIEPASVEPASVEPAPAPVPVAPAPTPVAMTVALKSPARVAPREDRRPDSTPPAYVGTLSIDASPGGDVFVDRQRAGHTPMRLENLKAGSHLIWIEQDGYRRWTRVVEVPADRVSRAFANLEPLSAR